MTTTVNGTTGAVMNGSWQSKHQVPAHFIGGNHLDAAAPGVVKDFVQNSEGHSVITSVGLAKPVQSSFRVANMYLVRFSLPTMVLPQSKKSGPCENGPTKPSATSGQSNLQ